MIFVYSKWADFCSKMSDAGLCSVPACEVLAQRVEQPFLVLKHDVETAVSHAHEMARIEYRFGHRGSYYVQAYLLEDENNVRMLQEIQQMGHEVSYHYDVMDSNRGDIALAIAEFDKNLEKFHRFGFPCTTICQHGNPVVERVGYHSNRDFFRSPKVQALYPNMADIMVDFKSKAETEYLYFSDAGREFRLIFDPINNDVVASGDKDVPCADLDVVLGMVSDFGNGIVSVHPHRWTASAFRYQMKSFTFKAVRFTAKKLMKIPFIKKLMGKYYYLAKKI